MCPEGGVFMQTFDPIEPIRLRDPFGREKSRRQTGTGKPHRSNSYLNYFEGYTEKQILDEKGKRKRIERIYTADYYRHAMTDGAWVKLKLLYVLLIAVCIALFFFCISRPLEANKIWFAAIIHGLTLICIGRIVWVLISYLSAGRRIKIGEYKASSAPLMGGCKFCWILMVAEATYFAVSVVLYKQAIYILYAFLFLLAGVAVALIGRLEKSVEYETVRNENADVALEKETFTVERNSFDK